MDAAAVILAAGQGTRMKSKLVKVLHPIAGRPMITYSIEAANQAGIKKPVVVVGFQGEQVRGALGDRAEYAEQPTPRGTGDAARCAQAVLENRSAHVLVYYGDMPLLSGETLQAVLEKHAASGARITMLTVHATDSMGFGRIVRDADGRPVRIVEEAEATPDELAITELNCGVYCYQADWLWQHLAQLKPSPKKGEYYLTDLIEMAAAEGAGVDAVTLEDVREVMGINTRVHLANVERIVRDRIRERVMLGGVTLIDPATTFIDAEVEIGADTVILPGTHLQGRTRIGADCQIGPNAIIRDSTVGDNCIIGPSMIEGARVEDGVQMGPFCHLRSGAHLGPGVRLGNFAEVKNSHLGAGVHMGHFSYMGDAEVGAHTNIGAGTITCNFDGKQKHRTIIGQDTFIGSDSMLVAPVTIGDRARTGAGAVVTKDVPADSLAVGVPARVIRKLR